MFKAPEEGSFRKDPVNQRSFIENVEQIHRALGSCRSVELSEQEREAIMKLLLFGDENGEFQLSVRDCSSNNKPCS